MSGRSTALTGLRAVAALWVMLFHFQTYKVDQVYSFGKADPLITRGGLGVDLFFILSGFIMLYVYAGWFQRQVNGGKYTEFLIYRIARLYPVHLLSLTIMLGLALASLLVGGRAPSHLESYSREAIVTNLLLVHAWFAIDSPNIPSWSISAEWFAYLLFPSLCYFIQKNRYIPAIYCASAVMALAFLPKTLTDNELVMVAVDFVAGMEFWRLLGEAVWPKMAGICTFSAIVLLLYWGPESKLLLIVAMAILIAALARDHDYLGRALSYPIPVYFGNISYSIYMIHWPVRTIMRELFAKLAPAVHPLLMIATYCIVTVIVAAITYHFVEVPGRRLIRRIGMMSEKCRHDTYARNVCNYDLAYSHSL